MAKKNQTSAIVYSTDKNFSFDDENKEDVAPSANEQKLKVRLDTKHRGGKAVTIVDGYSARDIEETGRKIKVFCGTGGSVKEGQIIIQGDHRDKVMQWLAKNGFKDVKKS